MKNILFLTIVIFSLWSCSDNESGFDVAYPTGEWLRFEPIAGGAIMRYELPKNKEIRGINIRYRNDFGEEVLCRGTYISDSLVLTGFNEKRENVTAEITLSNLSGEESAPLEVTFSTEDSGPVAFIRNVEVTPGWNGFTVRYEAPQRATGMAHVFYLARRGNTEIRDTTLMASFPIVGGADTTAYQLKYSEAANDVIIRVEDLQGHLVKERVWEQVVAYNTTRLDPAHIAFEDPNKLSNEKPEYHVSHTYLFDGELKWETAFRAPADAYYTYLAGPYVLGKDLFILELDKPYLVGSVRFYANFKVWRSWSSTIYKNAFRFGNYLHDMCPCKLVIYASNDKTHWQKVGTYEQDKEIATAERWIYGAYETQYNTLEAIAAADPIYLDVTFPVDGVSYRYLKVVVNELYFDLVYQMGTSYKNSSQYLMLSEVEVYTAKE